MSNDHDLVGLGEIRRMFGDVSRQRAYVVTRSRSFPLPLVELEQGPIWRRSDVEAWIREHRPQLTEG